MAPAIGTFIIVFLVVGVLSFLIIPVFMGFWTTARFTRRFEHLVREGYVDVVLARPHENDTRSAGGRNNKVSAASLCEAWMDIRSSRAYGPAGGGIEDEKEWKPASLSFKPHDDERPTSVRDAILTTPEQRKEASEMHTKLRIAARQHLYSTIPPPITQRPVSPHEQHPNLEALSDSKSENTSKKAGASTSVNPSGGGTVAATVRMCVFILMPSADNPNIQKKRVSASASGLAVGPGISSGIQRRGEEAQQGSDCPRQDVLSTQNTLPADVNGGGGVVPTVAMGILTSNLEDASEIIASNTNSGRNPSLVSVDDDGPPTVAGTRVLYPIMFGGRTTVVVSTARPLGYARSRVL